MKANHYFQIPDTDLNLFKLGFGTVDAGTKISDSDLFNCVDFYLEKGGNVIDTARIYGEGQSELAVGRWLAKSKKRDKVIIVTKGGHPPLSDLHESRIDVNQVEFDINQSLKALGCDYIDLYFLHRDDTNKPIEYVIDMMESLVKQGKIRYYGCSNFSTSRMIEADNYARKIGARGFAANEMFYNIASSGMNSFPDDTLAVMDPQMKEYHSSNRQNLSMPYFSVCSGFFHKLHSLGSDSVKDSPYYTDINLKIYQKVLELASKYNASLTQILLGFYSIDAFCNVPLFSTHKVEHLSDALGYLDINFDKNDFNI